MHFITPPDDNNHVWHIHKCDDTHVRMVLESSGDHTWIDIEYLSKFTWYTSLVEWLSS